MTETQSTAERMTLDAIRRQGLHYQKQERQLLEQMRAMEKAGGMEQSAAGDGRNEKIVERARAKLNGHAAALLKPVASGQSLSEIRIELEATRLIIQALAKKSVEVEALEAVEQADKLAPTESGLVRDWALTTARWMALNDRITRFYQEAPPAVAAALPLSHLQAGYCQIETPCALTIDELLALALAEGVVTAAELRKARAL